MRPFLVSTTTIPTGRNVVRRYVPSLFALTSGILLISGSSVLAAEQTAPVMEEIVVMGQKFERTLQDTPNSVSVVTELVLEEETLLNLSDVLLRTANAVPTGGGTGFTLRGIDSRNVAGAGFADLATIYLDNAPMSRDTVSAGAVDTWDLARVEVLRGPQSTVQGRNSLAGAIILATVDPSYSWKARARYLTLDDTKEDRFGLALGGPIIAEQFAFRVAYETSNSTGVIENPTRDEQAGGNDSDMIRFKLLIEPEAIPGLRVKLSHMQDERKFGLRESFLFEPSGWDNRLIFSNRPTSDEAETRTSVLDANYEINDVFDITLISNVSKSERIRVRDLDYREFDEAFAINDSATDTTSHELRLGVNAGPLTGVLGLYYSDVDNKRSNADSTFFFDVIEDLNLTGVLVSQGLDLPTAELVSSFYSEPFVLKSSLRFPSQIDTRAVFGDFSWDLSERFSVLAVFRWDEENQAIGGGQVVTREGELPNPALFPPQLAPVIGLVNGFLDAQVVRANTPSTVDDSDFSAFLPKLGASYHLTEEQTLSILIQKGYRSGGIGTNAAQASVHQFGKESTWNYELSYRSRWIENRLTVNANVYFTDWSDQQVVVYLSGNTFDNETQNAGKSEVKGFELETSMQFSERLNGYVSLGFSDTEFKEFEALVDGEIIDLSGNEFPNAPDWTVSAGFSWNHPKGWFVNLNANYSAERFSTASDPQADGPNIPERTLVNFKAGWQNDYVGIFAIGRNVFDEKYFDTRFIDTEGLELGRFGAPQLFGLSIEGRL